MPAGSDVSPYHTGVGFAPASSSVRSISASAFRPGKMTTAARMPPSLARSLHGAEIDERVVCHDHERALLEREVAVAVVLDDLELAHAVAHRAARVVVRLEL